jgi:hypothetical protein
MFALRPIVLTDFLTFSVILNLSAGEEEENNEPEPAGQLSIKPEFSSTLQDQVSSSGCS